MRNVIAPLALMLVAAACTRTERKPGDSAACGIATVVGPTSILAAFTVPNQTLSEPPARLPERTVTRLVAGPTLPALVGRSDTGLVIGTEGSFPADAKPTFGVLVSQRGTSEVQGVMIYEGAIIEAAPLLGIVSVGASSLPLIGVEMDLLGTQDPKCPVFPHPAS